jgi:hypothetical protein
MKEKEMDQFYLARAMDNDDTAMVVRVAISAFKRADAREPAGRHIPRVARRA